MNDEQNYLSAADAARILGLTRQRVTALAHQGRIGRRIGYYYVFTRAELDRHQAAPKSKGGRPRKDARADEGTQVPERV